MSTCDIITRIEDIKVSLTSQGFFLQQIFTEGPILHGDYLLEVGFSSGAQNAVFPWCWRLGSQVTEDPRPHCVLRRPLVADLASARRGPRRPDFKSFGLQEMGVGEGHGVRGFNQWMQAEHVPISTV